METSSSSLPCETGMCPLIEMTHPAVVDQLLAYCRQYRDDMTRSNFELTSTNCMYAAISAYIEKHKGSM